MERYDPLVAPDPEAWQALDEDERIELVLEHHEEADVDVPNEVMHATIHAIVENQVALGDETVVEATLARLQREGLDRHEAVHAVGSVLMSLIFDAVGSGQEVPDAGDRYAAALEKLTAASWREDFG